jgi:hypothetical protein
MEDNEKLPNDGPISKGDGHEADKREGGASDSAKNSEATPVTPDPFDPKNLQLSQDFGAGLGVQKVLTKVPVDKPPKDMFFRCHPDESYSLNTGVVELKKDRETYLVAQGLRDRLERESTFGARRLVLTVTRYGDVSFYPIRLPGPDGKLDSWAESALEIVELAKSTWVRVAANMNIGAYEAVKAENIPVSPVWPEMSLRDLL